MRHTNGQEWRWRALWGVLLFCLGALPGGRADVYELFPGGRMAQVWFLTGGCGWDACTMCDYGQGPAIGVSAMVAAVDSSARIATSALPSPMIVPPPIWQPG